MKAPILDVISRHISWPVSESCLSKFGNAMAANFDFIGEEDWGHGAYASRNIHTHEENA